MQVAERGNMDINRMRSRTKTMGAGVVPGKCLLDMDWIAEAMANAESGGATVIPGGAREENHDAMPGYLSFGLRCGGGTSGSEADVNEFGIVSLAGIDYSVYNSHRSFEGQFVFQGVVTTEQRVSGHHMDRNTHDPHHGYATVRVGVTNTQNNGPFMIYANQLIMWRIPPLRNYSPTGPETGDMTLDLPIINQRARGGDPNTMYRWEIVPFDPRDMTMYVDGDLATMKQASRDEGINDLQLGEFFRWQGLGDVPTVSCEQETAAGRKYGYTGVGLAFVETLAQLGYIQILDVDARAELVGNDEKQAVSQRVQNLAGEIGLWDNGDPEDKPWYKAMQNMFFMDSMPTDSIEEIKGNFERTFGKSPAEAGTISLLGNSSPADKYQKLRVHLSRFTEGSLIGAWYEKTSKIIGRGLNTTAPGDEVHLLAGHVAI